MAAQIGLDERGEPANLPVGTLIGGKRPYEGGLRVIQLGGNLLHPGNFRPVSSIKQAHARGVSGKGPVGEGVYDVDTHTATISTPITAGPSPIREKWTDIGFRVSARPHTLRWMPDPAGAPGRLLDAGDSPCHSVLRGRQPGHGSDHAPDTSEIITGRASRTPSSRPINMPKAWRVKDLARAERLLLDARPMRTPHGSEALHRRVPVFGCRCQAGQPLVA